MIEPKKVYEANVNTWPYEFPIDRQLEKSWTAEEILNGVAVHIVGNSYMCRQARVPKKPSDFVKAVLIQKYRAAGWRVIQMEEKPDHWLFYFPAAGS